MSLETKILLKHLEAWKTKLSSLFSENEKLKLLNNFQHKFLSKTWTGPQNSKPQWVKKPFSVT